MSPVVWGAEIPCDGVRPAWLADGERVYWGYGGRYAICSAGQLCWDGGGLLPVRYFRLRADHFYYAIPAGMTIWPGGLRPADWDNGRLFLRNGAPGYEGNWCHDGGPDDIVAYTKCRPHEDKPTDFVRVLRVVEYRGTRADVADLLAIFPDGEKINFRTSTVTRVATAGELELLR